jgi:hypothetical protein
MQIDLTKVSTRESTDVGIELFVEYSHRVIDALKAKAKEYNLTGTKKVYFYQLKSVFIKGAAVKIEGKTINDCGFARVNMYLRHLNTAELLEDIRGLEGDFTAGSLDFTKSLSPKEADFAIASEDIKKYNLDFDVDSIEELYIEEYGNAPFYQEYL